MLFIVLALALTACSMNERRQRPAPVADATKPAQPLNKTSSASAPATQNRQSNAAAADSASVYAYRAPPGTRATTSQPTAAVTASAPNATTLALASAAETDRRQGNLEQAAARLERAIRIDPTNAQLWHHLALIRLDQKNHQQAEELAQRSNALVVGRSPLLAENWRVIAKARRAQGNEQGARDAERRQAQP
jgi:tetratricopeptide (TPR) repeat protein